MIGKACLLRLKNNETYVGIIMVWEATEVHLHTWNQKKNKLSDTVHVILREDCLTIAMPIEGVSNDNFIGNVRRQAEEQQEEALRRQKLQDASKAVPRIQRPS